MQRKSVGCEVPALPSWVRLILEGTEDLSPYGPHYHESSELRQVADTLEPEVVWAEPPIDPATDAGIDRPSVITWLPDDTDDYPAAFFAARQLIENAFWLVRGEVIPDLKSGLLKLRRITVEPWEHEAELTGTVLRGVNVARLRDGAFSWMRTLASQPTCRQGADPEDWWPDFDPSQPAYEALLRAQSGKRQRGRPGHPDEHYRKVALVYLELYEAGEEPLLRNLGQRLGVPSQTARDWVHRARELGFLLPGKQGRKGASPGPRLHRESLEDTT